MPKQLLRSCPLCFAPFSTQLARCPKDGASLVNGVEPLMGQLIDDRYKLVSMLGAGGMGCVFVAEHALMRKRFALKLLFGDMALSENILARFRREAQTASRLDHLNIINVTDFNTTRTGLPYIVMEFLRGKTLAQVVEEEGPLSPARVTGIGKQIALALAHAHENGILHRDLKPENIILEDRIEASDFVKVLDFGLAGLLDSEDTEQLTAKGKVVGTPDYVSPEQAQGLPLNPAADLYSLGVVLYYLLSKQLPFGQNTSPQEALSKHVFAQPRSLKEIANVPVEYSRVVMRLLRKAPETRYANGWEVAEALEGALQGVRENQLSSMLSGGSYLSQTQLGAVTAAQIFAKKNPGHPLNEELDVSKTIHEGIRNQHHEHISVIPPYATVIADPPLQVPTPASHQPPEKRASTVMLIAVAITSVLVGWVLMFFLLRI